MEPSFHERIEWDTTCTTFYGAAYNETTHSCQCGLLDTCLSSWSTAPFCDTQSGICMCSSNVSACTNPGETCIGGECVCGNRSSCDGNPAAPYCDPENSVCKCSKNRDACLNAGETCKDGDCYCGAGESCENNSAAPYCNVNQSNCYCTEQSEACNAGSENCIDDLCKNIGKLIVYHNHCIGICYKSPRHLIS